MKGPPSGPFYSFKLSLDKPLEKGCFDTRFPRGSLFTQDFNLMFLGMELPLPLTEFQRELQASLKVLQRDRAEDLADRERKKNIG